MKIMEYSTPTRAPRSLYISPWKKDQFRFTHLDDSRARRPSSPASFLLSRSAWRRYGRIAISLVVVVALIALGSQLLGLEALRLTHENGISQAILVDAVPPYQHKHTPPPLPKPVWEDLEDESPTVLSYGVGIDWSKQAYATYATSGDYLCNALMLFARLVELKTKARKVLIHPNDWIIEDDSAIARMLRKARDDYGAALHPINVLRSNDQEPTWADSYTKLLVFNVTQYEKVLYIDNDGMVLQSLDDMFSLLLLGATAALPRAYWVPDQPVYSSHFMLLKPSPQLLEDEMLPLFHTNKKDIFDMDIVNTVLGPSCMVLPHRPWTLLSGEFFRTDEEHRRYLGSPSSAKLEWNAEKELAEAKTVHFSDWPVPKPWLMTSRIWVEQEAPECKQVVRPGNGTEAGVEDCSDRKTWLLLRKEFARRRKDVCGADDGIPDLFDPVNDAAYA